MIYDDSDSVMLWRKDGLFKKWCWINWMSILKKLCLDSNLIPYTVFPNIRLM